MNDAICLTSNVLVGLFCTFSKINIPCILGLHGDNAWIAYSKWMWSNPSSFYSRLENHVLAMQSMKLSISHIPNTLLALLAAFIHS